VGEAEACCADPVRGVDGGGSAEACGVSRSAVRQERAGGAAGSERGHFVTVSVRPEADVTAAAPSLVVDHGVSMPRTYNSKLLNSERVRRLASRDRDVSLVSLETRA